MIFRRRVGILSALPALSISSLHQLGKAAGAKAQVMAVESIMLLGLQGPLKANLQEKKNEGLDGGYNVTVVSQL
jgi:hypothetical protein